MKKKVIIAIASFLIGVLIASSCRKDVVKIKEKIVVKNVKVTDTVRIHDTIRKPIKVYVDRWKYVRVPVDAPIVEEIVEANKYSQKLIGKKGTAQIDVVTTGELLDLSGIIECNEKIVEKTITKYVNKNSLFFSSGVDLNVKGKIRNIKVGLDYNIRNRVLIKGGIGYDVLGNQPLVGIGIGFGL